MRHGFAVVWSGWIPGLPKAGNDIERAVARADRNARFEASAQ